MLQLETMHESMKLVEEIVSRKTKHAQGIGSSFLEFLTSRVDPPDRDQQRTNWQESLVAAMYQGTQDGIQGDTSTLYISYSRREALESVLLEKLRYSGMEDRIERIAKAYENTFQWIWEARPLSDKAWSNFVEWLESDSRLYWITGKAGSGKSTLMKFICQDEDPRNPRQETEAVASQQAYGSTRDVHVGIKGVSESGARSSEASRCQKHLRKWSGDSKLVMATFFFWNSGVQLQMTQKGLLLSLLHQILRQARELIPRSRPLDGRHCVSSVTIFES